MAKNHKEYAADGRQFETVEEENRYLKKRCAAALKANSKERKANAKLRRDLAKKNETIAKKNETIAKKNETIAGLKRDLALAKKNNKKLKSTIKGLNKYIDLLKRELARKSVALKKIIKILDMVDGAHAPTSKQIMKEMRKDKAAEDKKRTADRPGPKDGHKGMTDTRPATHSVTARLPPCKNCGCRWAEITKVTDGFVTDVERVVYTKTLMKHVEGSCYACGKHVGGKFRAKDVKEYGDGSNAADGDGGVVLIKHPDNEKFGVGDVVRTTGGDGGQVQVARTEDGAPEDAERGVFVDVGGGQVQVARTEDGAPEDAERGVFVDVGGGQVQVARTEDGAPEEGDVVECTDLDGDELLDVPESGNLGFALLHEILLQWRHRGVIRAIVDILLRLHNLRLSTATVWFALRRMAVALTPKYDEILERILRSPYVHVDETSFYVGKERKWVWFVGTREFSYYFVSTRKTAPIKEILKNYEGILIVDGYHTSKLLDPERVQRCTAHMDRDFKRWAKKEEMLTPHLRRVRNFCAAGRTIIHEAREAKKAGLGPEKYGEMCNKMYALIKYYKRYPEMAGIVNKVSNAMPSLFTFMNYSFVDSTNNLAERGMREVVKHRAVKSLLRTMEGAGVFAVLLTILMTNPDKDLVKLLKKYLGRHGKKDGKSSSLGYG